MNSPNSKYDHLFVVLRCDIYPVPNIKPEWYSDDEWRLIEDNRNKKSAHDVDFLITGIKAFLTQDEADKECERLNKLLQKRLEQLAPEHPEYVENPDFYFVTLVRIDQGLLNVPNVAI